MDEDTTVNIFDEIRKSYYNQYVGMFVAVKYRDSKKKLLGFGTLYGELVGVCEGVVENRLHLKEYRHNATVSIELDRIVKVYHPTRHASEWKATAEYPL